MFSDATHQISPRYRLYLVFAATAVVLVAPHLVAAQNFVPLAETPPGSKLNNIYSSTGDLSSFVNGLFKFAIGIAAIGAVIRIAYAGYLYMGSADMWSSKSAAKKILADVTLGLLLLMAIWLILRQINPDILKLEALKNITPAQQTTGPSGPTTQGNMQQFTTPPAQNSFFGGTGGQFDSSLNGCGVNGCDTFNQNPI